MVLDFQGKPFQLPNSKSEIASHFSSDLLYNGSMLYFSYSFKDVQPNLQWFEKCQKDSDLSALWTEKLERHL
jgi:hypothetical protein